MSSWVAWLFASWIVKGWIARNVEHLPGDDEPESFQNSFQLMGDKGTDKFYADHQACASTRAQALLQVMPPVEHHPDTSESDRPQRRLRGTLRGDH